MNQMMKLEPSLRAAAGAPDPVTWVDAGGTRLAAMRRGHGTPAVCLHAIGHGARDFEEFARRVGGQFEIIAIDWPGQGRSPAGMAPSAENYETLLIAALDALGLERVVLLGNSIGGTAALRAAAFHPERVSALILCNSGGLAAIKPFARFLIGRFVAFFRAGEARKRWFAPVFRFYYSGVLRRRPARAQRARIVASCYEIAGVLRQAWETFAQPSADLRHLAAQVECPVWLAWAKDDRIIAWPRCKRAARGFRTRSIQLFHGGHSAFLEDPDRFAAGFIAFMRKYKDLRPAQSSPTRM